MSRWKAGVSTTWSETEGIGCQSQVYGGTRVCVCVCVPPYSTNRRLGGFALFDAVYVTVVLSLDIVSKVCAPTLADLRL